MTYTINPVEAWESWLDDDLVALRDEVIPARLEHGANPRTMLVSGDNASGKSLVTEIIGLLATQIAEEEGVRLEVLDIGMKRRVSAGMERAFIFGWEPQGESTGQISVQVAMSGLENSVNRKGPHWLVLDEPDIGLGDGYHRALGEHLAAFSKNLPPLCQGFVVVTHSRGIARPLIDAGASSLRVGPDQRSVREWLENGDIEKSLADLLSLTALSRHNRKKIGELIGAIGRASKEETADAPSPKR